MAELSRQNRQRIRRGLMRYWSNLRESFELSAVLLTAVVATDEWIDANQGSFNSALPAEAQSGMTAAQKTFMFCCVALARVSIKLLRRVLGEVD